MALTLSKVDAWVSGNKKVRVYDITFDSSYPAGGEPLTASDVGLKKIIYASHGTARNATTGALPVTYDYTNSKLIAWYGDNNNAADGPLIENATADISAYSVRLQFEGW